MKNYSHSTTDHFDNTSSDNRQSSVPSRGCSGVERPVWVRHINAFCHGVSEVTEDASVLTVLLAVRTDTETDVINCVINCVKLSGSAGRYAPR